MAVRGVVFVAALAVLLALVPGLVERQAPAEPGRRVFVLHSGLHFVLSKPDKNAAAKNLRANLLRRGVADRDIVVLDNPFPTASWVEVVPRAGLDMYVQSMDPGSRVAQDAYRRFDAALRRHGVTSADRVVWVGHSAGGQMGMTLAHLAHSLPRYPELAKDARPYRFEMVVTLGTPVGSNHVPSGVKLRHYHSPADTVAGVMARNGSEVTAPLGYAVRFAPCCDLADNG